MVERSVDDGVGFRRGDAQGVEVVQRAAEHLGPGRGERSGFVAGAGEAEHRVARAKQLIDDGRPNPTGRPGDEYVHISIP